MLKRDVLVMVVLCGLSGVVSAAVALNQDFEGLMLGSLGTAGQGSPGDVGGKWFAVNLATDPSIVQDPCDPNNNQCVRITGGQAMLAGYSTAAPIAAGTPFILSFSVYPKGLATEEIGAFYLYCDSFSALNPTGTTGINIYNFTVGPLLVYDAQLGGYRSLSSVSLYTARDTWVDFKIHVTTWNDGSGYGRYDIWYNDRQGSGWRKVDSDNPFLASALHDGVNAVLIRPRMPSAGILEYFDNVRISSEPLDCQDAIIMSGGVGLEADFNRNCTVNMSDLGMFAHYWMSEVANDPVTWEYQWDCNELASEAMGGTFLEGPHIANGATYEVNDGIFTGSTAGTGGEGYLYNVTLINEDLYNASEPLMLEFRAKMVEATIADTAHLVIYDGDQGGLLAWVFRPGKYYEDAQGWSTYRVVTSVNDDGEITRGDLYYLDATGQWAFGNTSAFTANVSVVDDKLYFGDGGGGEELEGTWQEDYFYLTQNQASIESFLADVLLQQYDIDGDKMVNLGDFSTVSAEWMDSLDY